MRHAEIHAQDCAACETKKGMIDRIEREIELIGSLDGEQRARLLQIAEMCRCTGRSRPRRGSSRG